MYSMLKHMWLAVLVQKGVYNVKEYKEVGWLVVLGLTALWDTISVHIDMASNRLISAIKCKVRNLAGHVHMRQTAVER